MKIMKQILLILLLSAAISAEAGEKVKLTGSQLVERMSDYEVLAGISHEGGYNFMVVVYSNGTREVYWNDGIKSDTDTGTHRLAGDKICVTWQNFFEGKEQCFEVYKIGEEKYESWNNGKLAYTFFKIR